MNRKAILVSAEMHKKLKVLAASKGKTIGAVLEELIAQK